MAQQTKVRVGVLLTVGEQEGNKFELVDEKRRVPARPWVKETPEDFFIERPSTQRKAGAVVPPTVGIPGDVSIAEYIKFNHGNDFEIDYIHPKDITTERLKSNDINFLVIYDLLEAFHLDKKGEVFKRFREALHQAGNVFPSLEYQEFVNSKLIYYNHFKQNNIPIAPTITVSTDEWQARVTQLAKQGGPSAVAMEILEEVQRRGFQKFIAKPVYGQEAIGCKIFTTADVKAGEFTRFLRKNFEKFPGLIIQDFIKDFGDTKQSPELRMYFVGREYQFTAVATNTKTYTLKEDGVGGTLNLPEHIDLQALKALAYRAMDNMPAIKLRRGQQQVPLPKLLTRVDMGCIRDGVFNPWVNEVEFVPSMYIEDHRCPLDGLLGEQMVKITRQFLRLRREVTSPPRSSPSRTPKPRRSALCRLGSPDKLKKSASPRKSALRSVSRANPLSVRWGFGMALKTCKGFGSSSRATSTPIRRSMLKKTITTKRSSRR
jgi:hypothetical protein